MIDKKTLLLVYPANQLRAGFLINRDTKFQPLALGILAALTPPDWKIKLIDENFRTFNYYKADLVAITGFTATITRAYQIADIYKEKNIPVVMGGIHVSMCPDEALQHAHTIVTGEAETIWPQLIEDFLKGQLKHRYEGALEQTIRSPKPRRDLFHPAYIFASIQTSRGCPMDCSFCSVTAFNGRHYRFRPIEDVLDELEETPQPYVFFLDDNIIGYNSEARERAKKLFQGIIDRGIKKLWISQASINFADDDEVLELAAKSGCKMIFLGIETEGLEQLQEAGKKLNIKRGVSSFNDTFRKIQKHGISVIAGFIFGWDTDDEKSIMNRVRYIRACEADAIQTSILTPLPGTRMWTKFETDNRLRLKNFPEDWQHYDYSDMTFYANKLTPEEFYPIMIRAFKRIYSFPIMIKRFIRTLIRTKSMLVAIWSFRSNYNYRRMTFSSMKIKDYKRHKY